MLRSLTAHGITANMVVGSSNGAITSCSPVKVAACAAPSG
jgi:hypothetical protein